MVGGVFMGGFQFFMKKSSIRFKIKFSVKLGGVFGVSLRFINLVRWGKGGGKSQL